MENIQKLLQVSAKLYQFLAEIPKGEERDAYTEKVNEQLDARGVIIEMLRQEGFSVNPSDKSHAALIQLDKGIRERLQLIMAEVKRDLKDLQNQKKNEQQYLNPYSNVRTMDGMYYDKKK